MDDQEKIMLYRNALVQLTIENGGEMFIPLPDREAGSLMNRIENGGVRFKWAKDGKEN